MSFFTGITFNDIVGFDGPLPRLFMTSLRMFDVVVNSLQNAVLTLALDWVLNLAKPKLDPSYKQTVITRYEAYEFYSAALVVAVVEFARDPFGSIGLASTDALISRWERRGKIFELLRNPRGYVGELLKRTNLIYRATRALMRRVLFLVGVMWSLGSIFAAYVILIQFAKLSQKMPHLSQAHPRQKQRTTIYRRL